MKRMNYVAGGSAAFTAILLSTGTVMAATETGTVNVSATLTAACSIGDGTLAFGEIVSIDSGPEGTGSSASDDDADTGAISYVCSNGATPTLGIAGTNDLDGQFRMQNGEANYLAYDIYTDSSRTLVVAPAGVSSSIPIPLIADGTDKTITLYGRVPGATANQVTGVYNDTLILTVSY